MIPTVLPALALLGLALLLGATRYESVVMAPTCERDIPTSIRFAQDFLAGSTPAHSFRVTAPLTQLRLAASLIAPWRTSTAGGWVTVALGAVVLTDVITIMFHYPRLAIMFKAPLPDDPGPRRRAARGWARGNLARAGLLAVAFLLVLQAVTRPAI
jgi:hypothetical protein